MMTRTHILVSTMLIGILAILSACASVSDAKSSLFSPGGAWASGSDSSACETAPITYFSSGGVVLVFIKFNGPIHSFGNWSINADTLTMTHNDFPITPSGQSGPAVKLDILELTDKRFSTRNSKGNVRERIRCRDIEVNPNPDHMPHH